MARPIDENKIQRVKDEAVRLITQKGYAATSIAEVAERAGVATGYLYRHYPSKMALIQAIYEENMGRFHESILKDLDRGESVKRVISGIVDFLHNVLVTRKEIFNFMFLMLHDHTFEFPKKRLIVIREICERIHLLGKKTGEINSDYDAEAIFYTLFSVPLKFLDSRSRKVFLSKPIESQDVERVKKICCGALA